MSELAGQTLEHYRLVEKIGEGGMGVVWKATDTRLGRSVAVKVLPSHVSCDPELRERFDREARTISQLNHPGICILHDIGRHEGTDFIVMELVEGESLAQRLTRGPLPLSEGLQIGVEIAEALHEAHRAGIVHRDLKPGNIMLTRRGTKLLDFGLAKLVRVEAPIPSDDTPTASIMENPVTRMGAILGTLHYMAPEQLEGREVDARADIFSLGCVLYEMFAGERPFSGSSQAAVITAVMTADPPSLTGTPGAPELLDHLVVRCLAKEPDDRWQSTLDLAGQLRWISESLGRSATSSNTFAPPTGAPAQPAPHDYRIAYFTSADGAVIAAARGGQGRPLFIVPAMVDTIESRFSAYAESFPEREIIVYDRRGTGLSERGPDFNTAQPYLEDARAVVEGFELIDFDVLGTLMGTIEAASIAAWGGDRIGRLVLRLPVMGLDDWAAIPAVGAALASMERDWIFFTEAISQMVVGWGNPGGPVLARRFQSNTTRDELRSMFDAFVDLDLASVYPDIQSPTLIEHNPAYFFPDSYSRRIASLIPECRMVIYRGPPECFLSDFTVARDFLDRS